MISFDFRSPVINECSSHEIHRPGNQIGKKIIDAILYADDEEVFAKAEMELKGILEIYDQTFSRLSLIMVLSKLTLWLSMNIRILKYLDGFGNDLKTPKQCLHLRISSAFSKLADLKHVFTGKCIYLFIHKN